GEELVPKQMFKGFDHRKYDAEVRERWGDEAADRSRRRWAELGERGREEFQMQLPDRTDAWDAVIASAEGPSSDAAQQVAAQHLTFLRVAWQTGDLPHEAVAGVARMYADDPRFAKNYTRVSPSCAGFARYAIVHSLGLSRAHIWSGQLLASAPCPRAEWGLRHSCARATKRRR